MAGKPGAMTSEFKADKKKKGHPSPPVKKG